MKGGFGGIRRVFRIRNASRELDEELGFHFERSIEELVAGGLTPQQARQEAARRFGDERAWRREIGQIDRRLATRNRWADRSEAVSSTFGYALRRMRRSPGFTLGVVLTFALGIGANATMFGIVDRLLLSPPAHVAAPDEVRRIMIDQYVSFIGERVTGDRGSYPDFESLQRADAFSSVAGVFEQELTLGRGNAARPVAAKLVTGEFFPLLGVRPKLGRFFGPEEDSKGAATVAVISDRVWQRDFGGERSVIGETLDFGYGPVPIIGVAPQGFTGVGLEEVDIWLPLHAGLVQMGQEWWMEGSGNIWLQTVARLAPGVSAEQANAQATALHRQARQEEIQAGDYDPDVRVLATPLIAARGPNASDESRVALWLGAISLIVLLIACANVANLLLARAARQRGEIGIRLALGSSRGRIIGQVVTEGLLLAFIGGVAAFLVARWGGAFVRGVLLPEVAWTTPAGNIRVAAFVVVVALIAGLAAALLPGLQSSRPDVANTLRSGGRNVSKSHSRTRAALTILQAALSVVLLVGAGLFVRSLDRVHSLDLGFDPEGVLMVRGIFEENVPAQSKQEFYRRALERLRTVPAVDHVAASVGTPFGWARASRVRVPGLDSLPRLPTGGPYIIRVTPGYFRALDLQIPRGAGFTDSRDPAQSVIVNQTMARLLWPGKSALGKCLLIGAEDPTCSEVVGVVENARRSSLVEDETMQYYVPLNATLTDHVPDELLLRSGGDLSLLMPIIQRELLALEPRLRVAEMEPLRDRIDPQARSWRLGATMFTAFGILALLVAAIGLYSVLAFTVAQRTFELGIRSALGASRQRLMRLVFKQAMQLVGLGVTLGLAFALLAGPRVEPLLFETSPRDPLVLMGAVITLLIASAAASSLPAWRATRVHPAVALRAE